MQKRGKDPKPATAMQYATLTGEIALAVAGANPSFDHMQELLGSKVRTRGAVTAALKALKIDVGGDSRLLKEQQFLASLGIAVDIAGLTIPELPRGFNQIAINPVGQLRKEKLFELCSYKFLAWKYYNDLDKTTAQEQARPKTTYVFGYRGGTEPDKEHLGKSHNKAMAEGMTFLTLEERIWAELRYFANTGRHLDEVGWTITSSLASDGIAFGAGWDSGDRRFRVRGYRCSDAYPNDGPCEAVFA